MSNKCPTLVYHLKNMGGDTRIFVVEKEIIVDEAGNCHDSRVINGNPSDFPPVMKSKKPDSVLVFTAIKVTPSHLIET